MDKTMPIKIEKKWIPMVACAVAVALVMALCGMALGKDTNIEQPTVGTVNTQLPTSLPTLIPTEPTLPTMPEPTVPSLEGAIMQESTSQSPVPYALVENTLRWRDFTKKNGYITCKVEECWLGVDVSVWQEDIDWEKVAAAGVKFAMIRIAYRGYGRDAKLNIDPTAEQNIQGAMAAGLKVGVYIYSQAINVEEAIEEAQFVLALLDGRELQMPVVYDWEVPDNVESRTSKVKAKTIHASAMAFCAEIKAAGYRPMVYFNQWQGRAKYDLLELRKAGVELWLAMYMNAMVYKYQVQMWQYTDNGRVPGIDGRVDIDLYFPYW